MSNTVSGVNRSSARPENGPVIGGIQIAPRKLKTKELATDFRRYMFKNQRKGNLFI